MGFFPVDAETLRFLRRTGRSQQQVDLVQAYMKAQGLFAEANSPICNYSKRLKLDLAEIEPALAGPKRPQDRVPLKQMQSNFRSALTAPIADRGFGLPQDKLCAQSSVEGTEAKIGHGSVVIAAITSCTNTSNPSVMLGAGLLAQKAVAKGLRSKPYVKTSLAPGSRVVTDYFDRAGVSEALDTLGFQTVGYGCTTCIGNSGPLPENVGQAITSSDLVAAAVLSGNRNFEGRVNPLTRANYLASPPLVVAYALAGSVDFDFDSQPLGTDQHGQPVYLREIWPTAQEIKQAEERCVVPELFEKQYSSAFTSNEKWNAIGITEGDLYQWQEDSTYIQRPPFLEGIQPQSQPPQPITAARCLAVLGDSVTTDHISPAGSIGKSSPAGKYLIEHGVQPADFNSYGARRGNDRVMIRGTFANIRIRNQMTPNTEGGVTLHVPSGQQMTIYDAAMEYSKSNTPLIILAGAEYGTGSSRDWAAKGTMLLGVRAVIATSFERIHRSNLVGMGILPLQFQEGQSWQSLGLTGTESYQINCDKLQPRGTVEVQAQLDAGKVIKFQAMVRIDTPVELDYYNNGGILPTVLRKLATN
jgi:aconitate hydratase